MSPSPPAAPAFEWTDSPSPEAIPGGPVTGEVEGKAFTAKTVLLQTAADGALREFVISDQSMLGDDDPLLTGTSLVLQLGAAPAPGMVDAKGLYDTARTEECDAWYQVPDPDDGGPSQVRCPWAAAIVIDELERLAYRDDGPKTQVGGTCKGRLALCFEKPVPGSGDKVRSWVAGEFEAAIRYLQPPDEGDGTAPESQVSD